MYDTGIPSGREGFPRRSSGELTHDDVSPEPNVETLRQNFVIDLVWFGKRV